VPSPRRIDISVRSGRVSVRAGASNVRVSGAEATFDADGNAQIRASAASVTVECPAGTDLVIGSTAGRVETRGPLGAVNIATVSGRISVESARSVDVRTTSARVDIGTVEGAVRCSVVSGRVTVEHAGSVDISVKSGRVEVQDTGDARVHALSGRVEVAAGAGSEVDVRTTSGRVAVTLPNGSVPTTNLSVRRGGIANSIPSDATITAGRVTVQSVAGRVSLAWR
jgi:Putative adhesin